MGWFRLRSRWGSCSALFALALQLALSFGHVHVGRVSRDSSIVEIAATNGAHAPAGRKSDHSPSRAHDDCAVCALIHLAGALLAEQPSLPPAPAFGRSPHEILVEFDLTAPLSVLFQARAPPLLLTSI
jgi:hypothetical protein